MKPKQTRKQLASITFDQGVLEGLKLAADVAREVERLCAAQSDTAVAVPTIALVIRLIEDRRGVVARLSVTR